MKIQYLAHSSFLLTSDTGIRIVIDPYDPAIGYSNPYKQADVILVSHAHPDHYFLNAVLGKPSIVKGCGSHSIDGLTFKGILADHDAKGGAERGSITIYTFTIDGIKFCYLSDLGHVLTPDQIKEIGEVDILFIPVGGYYTIGPDEANTVVEQLKPKVVIPMHYLTAQLNRDKFPIQKVDAFISGLKNVKIVRNSEIEVSSSKLPAEREIVVLTNEY